jgi:predicted permease
MEFQYLLLAVFKSILQVVMLTSTGIFLRVLGILSKANIKVISDLNFYLLLPMFTSFELANSIDLEKLYIMGFSLLSCFLALLISLGVGILVTRFSGIDKRIRFIYISMCCISNTFSMPVVVVAASCSAKGILESFPELCKESNNGQFYSTITIIATLVFWAIAFASISIDRNFSNKYRSEVAHTLKYYTSLKDFMNSSKTTLSEADTAPSEDDISTQLKIKCTLCHYSKFELKYKAMLEMIAKKYTMEEYIAALPEKYSIKAMYLLKTLLYPPSFTVFLGVLLAMNTRFKLYIFHDKSFSMFLATIQKVYNMTIPVSYIILGSKLVDSFVYLKSNFVTGKDIVLLNLQRFLLMPLIGIAFMYLVKACYPGIKTDTVLSLAIYMQWTIPCSTSIIAAFVKEDYGAEDAAQLMLYGYIVCTFPMTIFVALWGHLFMR